VLRAPLFNPVVSVRLGRNPLEPQAVELSEGLITGKVERGALFADIQLMTDALNLPAICTNDLLYPKIREWMCALMDLPSHPAEDLLPVCNMLALAIAFDPVKAKLGEALPEPLTVRKCAPEIDPIHETCVLVNEAGAEP